jgi:hypothetical protein
MTSHPPWDAPAADAGGGTTMAQAADTRPGRRLIAVMLLTAAALDLARCGIVLATARHAAPATGLVAAGLAAAALSLRTARGCQGGRRWSGWAALLIGAASAPQAAASGFHTPYTIPDTATAALGVLLAVAVLATAGQAGSLARRDSLRGSVPDAIHHGQDAAIFMRRGEPSAAQRGTFGRDEAAPDTVLADCPMPQRQLQACAAHGTGPADSDGAGRLAAGCLRFSADREPFVGIKSAIGASRLPGDLGAQRPIGQLRG